MRSFQENPPADAPTALALFEDVAIGWQHTVVDDEIVFTLDDAGQRIPTVYRVPTRRTPREVLVKVGKLTVDDLRAAILDGFDGMAAILGKIAGRVVRDVLDDPTVDPDAANAFLGWLADVYGLASILGLDGIDDGGDAAPLDEGQAPPSGDPLPPTV